MQMKFHGVVKAVREPETREFAKGDKTDAVTRLRVVAESGPLVDKTLEDGRTVKDRQFKEYFDVQGWGGPGRALARVNVGEAIHVAGDLRQADAVKMDNGEMFYPKDTLRVSQVDFIGLNKAAAGGLAGAVQAVDQEVAQGVADDMGIEDGF